MRLLFVSHVLSACLFYTFWASASGQYYDDPTLFFKPFEFDSILRGQYNVTQCVLDLLTCWENIRPDVMCDMDYYHRYDYETYCAVLKRYCSDYLGDYDGKSQDEMYREINANDFERRSFDGENLRQAIGPYPPRWPGTGWWIHIHNRMSSTAVCRLPYDVFLHQKASAYTHQFIAFTGYCKKYGTVSNGYSVFWHEYYTKHLNTG